MDPKTFNDDVAQWKLQPADDIKTVVGDPTYENISEPSDPSDNNKTCQSVGRKEVNSYCQTLDFNHFKPREVKAVRVRPIDPFPKPSLLTIDPKISEKGWSVQDGLLPANSNDFIVYIKNLTRRAKTLNKNASIALIEEVDDAQCVDISYPEHTEERRPDTNLSKRTEETLKRLSLDGVTSIDQRIWSEINAYPPAIESFFTPKEQSLSEEDEYFERVINEKFMEQFDVSPDLTPRQRYLIQRYLEENQDIYAFQGDQLGRVTAWKHRIPTGDHAPIKQNPYRFSEAQKAEVEKQVSEMMRLGVIVPAVTSWASPVTLAPKRDGTWRFCIDYRKLNDITRKDSFPVPRLDEALSVMRGCDRFSVQDAQSCFWQIPLHKDDQEKTTFCCHLGTFMFRVMPFGLTGAPASCVRAMSRIFMNLERRIGFIYMDDLICFSKGVEEQVRRLHILAERCRKFGLKMRADKCTFAYPSVSYLGHKVSGEGISPDLDRHKDILQKPKPSNVKELQSFLGFANFFRTFIVNFAQKAFPLTKLLRKQVQWEWTAEQDDAHQTILKDLTNPPVLAHYDPDADLEIRVDASDEGLGCVLVQIDKNGKRQLLAAYSRTYLSYEENYGITHKECLGILFGIRQARPFVFGRRFTVVTDHCGLCYLMKAKDLNSRLARWSLELAVYDFKIVYNSGRTHGDADFMSRNIAKCLLLHPKTASFDVTKDMCLPLHRDLEPVKDQYIQDWNPEKTKTEQLSDELLGPIIKQLSGELPASKRQMNRLIQLYEITNGLLFRYCHFGPTIVPRLAIPKSLIRDVLYVCHDLPAAGHFGYAKTLWKVKQYAYWPNMSQDVLGYVRSCRECQFRKMPNYRPFGPQSKIFPIADNVMKAISIDLVGPLTQMDDDNKHVLTITDQLSKFAIAVPLFETKDVDIMEALERNVFYKYGPPAILLSDNGRNLCSRSCETFYESWGITHVTTTPFHPNSNGQCEKFNGTLTVLLATQIKGEDQRWDQFVDSVVMSYNATPSVSTGFSPFYLMFGKQVDLPQMVKLGCRSAETAQGSDLLADRKTAIERIQKMQEKNVQIANEGRKVPNFQPNDLVLLLSQPMMQRKSAKLHFRYTGPYRIVRRHRDNVFEIEGLDGRKMAKVVNVMNIKRYYSRQDFTLSCEKGLRSQRIQFLESKVHNSSNFIEELSLWPQSLDILCITFVSTEPIIMRSDRETTKK